MRRSLRRAGAITVKIIASLIGLVALVAIGKACQYAAVDRFGAHLGFDLASLIGLAPFVAILVAADTALRKYCRRPAR